jgi:hypothetical protein
MKPLRIGVIAPLLAFALSLPSTTSAEEAAPGAPNPSKSAEVLFNRAMEVMDEGDAGRACPMLEESLRLDPAMGTRYRLAECYEKTNRQAAAFSLYSQVADEAKRAGMMDREVRARTRSEALAPLLARLVVWVPPDVANTRELRVTLDGAALERSAWVGETRIVELGEHVLEATAPGRKPYRRVVPVRLASEPVEVSIPALRDENEPAPAPRYAEDATRPVPVAESSTSSGNTAAIVLGLSGTGALVAGVGIAGMAAASGGMTDVTRASAGAGIGLGCLGVATAGVVWLVSRKSSKTSRDAGITLVPSVGPGDGGVSLVGRF